MSVEASKWARLADVQKSSSKLVLLNLAQLVRYDADQWTVFASIEYLAKVTHLNRKTVIEALGRLRELGAIQDTGRRAGDNRSSIIYRLCPNAVPLIDVAASGTAASGITVQPTPQQDFEFESAAGEHPDGPAPAAVANSAPTTVTARDSNTHHVADDSEYEGRCSEFGAIWDDTREPCLANALGCIAEAGVRDDWSAQGVATAQGSQAAVFTSPTHKHQAAADYGSRRRRGAARKRSTGASFGGAAATPLPSGWSLPERWQIWTQRERPHWSAEKIDAMAATFSAYMRSRPGDEGLSADWFESWRLWVFRERESKDAKELAKPWHGSWSGIVTKGKRLGLEQAPNEPEVHFKARVFAAAGLPPPH
ncbi:helix-turn-helix domain-containing protein [Achromobacter sp. UMC46]|uniref:helix-turn-helix domain-containing protein n=1 Tax=Achromobacter sp. UMC46 TaxID=1862319 RepID=UPI0016042E5A|nr:helix-turn-helix domain-containing protein [Achromobacter sp. UMC46]